MKIEEVDFFYLAMPQIKDIGDGSQDAMLVRVVLGNEIGWGECEASPLVCIANAVCPMSHSACKNVRETVRGKSVQSVDDISVRGEEVRAAGLDIAQTAHTWSGVEVALWDALGKARGEPAYRLAGYAGCYPKLPYASQLFGDTPQHTLQKAQACRAAGFRAAKFGWAAYGRGSVASDRDQVAAAREGLGEDGTLLVDAGTVWGDNVESALRRLDALEDHRAIWLEEPFVGGAIDAYAKLADRCHTIRLAAGEGATSFHAAKQLIDYGKIGFIQIDTGRIGGIGPALRVAEYATSRGVTFVNHTFTTHLALAASLVPMAGIESAELCEYPVEASPLARSLTKVRIEVGDGVITLPEAPGLGMEIDKQVVREYLVDVEIKVRGKLLYQSPEI